MVKYGCLHKHCRLSLLRTSIIIFDIPRICSACAFELTELDDYWIQEVENRKKRFEDSRKNNPPI